MKNLDNTSPALHKPRSGKAHIHKKYSVSYKGDATFDKAKKEGGVVQPATKPYESREAYLGDSSRNDPHKQDESVAKFGTSGVFGNAMASSLSEQQATTFVPPASGMQRMVDAGLRRDNFGVNNTRAIADVVYGTPEQRQMSMPQPPVFLKDKDGSGDVTQKDFLISLGKLDKEGNKTEKY